MIGLRVRPISRSMPSLIAGLPARPTPAIRPSLIPMSALTTPIEGSTTTAPVITTSSSDGPAAGPTGPSAGGGSSRSPTAARRPAPGGPPRRGSRGRCHRGGCDPPSRARTGRGAPRRRGGSPRSRVRRLAGVAHQADRPGLARLPALRAPAGRSSLKPTAASRSNQPRVHPVERVVRRDPDRAPGGSSTSSSTPPGRRRTRRRDASPIHDAPGPSGPAARRASGSTSTTSREPSPSSTSSRTSSTSSRTPSITSPGATAARPAASTSAYAPRPRRLEHRVAHERDRLGRVEREPGGPMPARQLGCGEDQQPLLLPRGQSHRPIVATAAAREGLVAPGRRSAAPGPGDQQREHTAHDHEAFRGDEQQAGNRMHHAQIVPLGSGTG